MRKMSTFFTLTNDVTKCTLKNSGKKLPEWGFDQQEITCDPSKNNSTLNHLWHVEHNENPNSKVFLTLAII